ncbi:Por secretion system C-terminal sorting domain-containing protein [Ekhidna lutea]|uniref:Por secretion system C-terminal sorting domain-containing protein n=1 Tax=Ekhidna lutea TaxID=447679 RepID=A0A239F589_EKHLU|nr:LamG-like jellyroll fold domain-containing protein [Ekhidna lutea]SNS52190.1 Por secretion system C-terminal sorting domain-containing protein [Ekhidna lutea]
MKHLLIAAFLITISIKGNSQCTVSPVVEDDFSTADPCWNLAGGAYVSTGELRMWPSGNFEQVAVLPAVNNAQGVLTLDARRFNSFFGAGTIDVGTMPCPTCYPSFQTITSFTPTETTPTSYTFDLSSYTGSNQYIALRSPGYNSGGRANFDNVYYRSQCASSTGATAVTKNITVFLDETGQVIITPEDVDDGSADSCGDPVTLSLDVSSFTCDDLGDNTVVLTAEDTEGNTHSSSATVTVKPTILFAATDLYLDETGSVTIAIDDIDKTGSSICSAIAYSLDQSTFDCTETGFHDVSITATYGSGLTHTSSMSINVYDSTSPAINAQNLTVQLDETTGVAEITTVMVDNGTTDNCTASLDLAISQSVFTCEDIGENTITFSAEDEHGNIATGDVIITINSIIEDETVTAAQTEFCLDGTTGTTISTGSSVSGIDYYLRNSEDNSVVDGPITGTGGSLDFSTGNLSETTTFNVIGELNSTQSLDGEGLAVGGFTSTTSYVEIPNSESLKLNENWTIEAWVKPMEGNQFYSIVETYNSSGGYILRTTTSGYFQAYAMFSSGSYHTVTSSTPLVNQDWNHVAATFNETTNELKIYINGVLNATNANATIDQRGSTHTIKLGARGDDNQVQQGMYQDEVRIWNIERSAQEISNAKDVTLSGSESGLVAYYDFDDMTFESSNMVIPDRSSNGNNGTMKGTYTSTNIIEGVTTTSSPTCEVQMSTEVTIGDNTPPEAIGQNLTISLDNSGQASINPQNVDNGSSDNCTSLSLTLSLSQETFTCDDLGTNEVMFKVEDSGGNIDSVEVLITVEDNTTPDVFATDITLILDANGEATLNPAEMNNNSTDNCGIMTFSLSQSNFSCADLGENEITLTVEDDSGNQASAVAIVTVVDNLAPTVATIGSLDLELDEDGNASLSPDDLDDGSSDNCTATANLLKSVSQSDFTCTNIGANSVVFTVEDESGNTATSTVTVNVVDNSIPLVVAQNLEVRLNENNEVVVTASEINNGSSDNCGEVTLEIERASSLSRTTTASSVTFTEADLGENDVTLTVTDESGNISTASAVVIVLEYKIEQTISFESLPSKVYGDAPIELSASATSELPVTFSIESGPATLSDNTLTITGVGLVIVNANQEGDAIYAEAVTVQQSFEVSKATLTVTADNHTLTYGDAIPALTITYAGFVNGDTEQNLDGLPSTFADLGGQEEQPNAGVYDIVVSGGLSENYEFVYVNGTLTINKVDQVISLDPIADKEPTDGPFDVVASVDSNLPLTFEVDGPASISGTTITLNGEEGVVSLTVSQAGDINHNEATASVSFNVALPLGTENAKQIEVYPNPTVDYLYFGQSEISTVRIFSIDGKMKKAVSITMGRVDVSELAPGSYIVEIVLKDEKITKRFIKAN